MASVKWATRERVALAGDAALLTAAILSVLTSLILLVAMLTGDQEVPPAIQVASAISVLVGGLGGPLLAWRMHHRPFTLPAAVGALVGGGANGLIFFLFVAVSTAVGWALSSINDAEWFGPLVTGALVATAFLGWIVWLLVEGVRDLRGQREHTALDVVRVVAGALVILYVAAIVLLASNGAGEFLEALAFMLVGALNAAVIVIGAEIATGLMASRAAAAEQGHIG